MSIVTRQHEKMDKKKVYYTGSDTLQAGYHLCYDADAIRSAEESYGKITGAELSAKTAADEYNERASRVEKPSATNLQHYAGALVEEYAGVVGPAGVEIYVPKARGQKVLIATDQSCTIDTTVLTLQAGSYFAGGQGDGPAIAKAVQTIDRSSTNGTVQALLVGLSHESQLNPMVAGAAGISPLIWDQIPLNEIRNNPGVGFLYENHFMGEIDATTGDGFTLTQSNSTGTIGGVATDPGGSLEVTSAGSTADDSLNVQLANCVVKPEAGVKIAFEARVNFSDATQQSYLGLCEVNTAILASGALEDTDDKAGFYHEAASTDNKISSVTARAAADDKTADVASVVDNTYMTLGFVIDGLTSIKFYVNGVLVETGSTAANIPNKIMVLSIFSGYESAAMVQHIDWIKLAQVGLNS
jgi:hypothetical protein